MIGEVNNALIIWSKVIMIWFLFQLEMKGMTEDRVGRAGSKDREEYDRIFWMKVLEE